ncbi:TPA: relaxase, partial [Streptococcus suis]|nr:relaxase [Streptococcus suis]HEP1842851.1 relaxase [Streptococcus suis]
MVAIKPPIQIKTTANLKRAVTYILKEAKTVLPMKTKTDFPFPVVSKNG